MLKPIVTGLKTETGLSDIFTKEKKMKTKIVAKNNRLIVCKDIL